MEFTRKHNLWIKILPLFLFCQILSILYLLFSCAFIDLEGLASFEKEITSFSFRADKNSGVLTYDANGTVNADSINITVPYGTSLNLTPTIVIKGKAVNPGNEVVQTFTDGVSIPYTVTGDDNSKKNYLVTVNVALCDAKDITAFAFLQSQNPLLPGDISGIISGTDISVTVPPGTDTSSLVPTVSITGVSLEPGNNVVQSFPDGTGVQYTVTAGDYSTKVYTVTVHEPPLPGNSGTLNFSGIVADSITVNWTKGTDGQTPQANLQYLVYYSTANNISTVAEIEANGTAIDSYAADIALKTVTGLSEGTVYYFAVIIKDQNNNKSAYVINTATTTDSTPPVAGNGGTLGFGTITPVTVDVTWTKAVDNAAPQTELEYMVYYSTANNIGTVTDAEANGTAAGVYQYDIAGQTVSGLADSTLYYFNIIVKDPAGNKTAYSTQSQTTPDGTPPVPGNSGILSCSSVTINSITAEWIKATDNVSLQADLQYLLYYSPTGNLATVTDIETNGTPAGAYTSDITTANLPGLTDNTTYYFNVIVKDQAGNKAAYAMNSRITLTQTVAVAGTTSTLVTPPAVQNAMGITTYGTNLYVTTWTGHTVIRIDKTTGTPTVLAGLDGVSGSADGTGTAARFNQPSDICTDGTNLYVLDTSNSSIRKIVIATGVVTTVATGFQTPYGITTDGTSLYVTNYLKHTVLKVVIETGVKTILAGTDGSAGTTDGIGTAAKFNFPWGICTDGVYLYVVDYVGARVRKVNINTAAVTTISTAVGNARGITTDGVNLYVCSYSSNQVNKIVIATNALSLVTGAITTPHYITTDGTKLYVTDDTNFYIRWIE